MDERGLMSEISKQVSKQTNKQKGGGVDTDWNMIQGIKSHLESIWRRSGRKLAENIHKSHTSWHSPIL